MLLNNLETKTRRQFLKLLGETVHEGIINYTGEIFYTEEIDDVEYGNSEYYFDQFVDGELYELMYDKGVLVSKIKNENEESKQLYEQLDKEMKEQVEGLKRALNHK